MQFKSRLTAYLASSMSVLHMVGPKLAWAALALVLFALVVADNPAKFYSLSWAVSKLTLAALVGYWVFLAVERIGAAQLEGIERAMADTRCVTLMAAFVLGAGLIP